MIELLQPAQTQIVINGVELTCGIFEGGIVREAFLGNPRFLSMKEDKIRVDMSYLIVANEDETRQLHMLMKAAGILVEEEIGAYGIYERGNAHRYRGPMDNDTRLYFAPDRLELAREYLLRVIPAIAEFDHAANVELCGKGINKPRLPELEIWKIIEPAGFEIIETEIERTVTDARQECAVM